MAGYVAFGFDWTHPISRGQLLLADLGWFWLYDFALRLVYFTLWTSAGACSLDNGRGIRRWAEIARLLRLRLRTGTPFIYSILLAKLSHNQLRFKMWRKRLDLVMEAAASSHSKELLYKWGEGIGSSLNCRIGTHAA